MTLGVRKRSRRPARPMTERAGSPTSMTSFTPPRKRTASALRAGTVALLMTLLAAPATAFAEGTDDPTLGQTLDANLQVVHGQRVLDAGHVDMGPKFVDGEWTFLIHDDAARADANATSVWRFPEETVLHVLDQGAQTVPDDAAYEFVGAEPGAPVWVIPQTQNPDVVWLGWNTQDPEVMQTIDRGVTLALTGAQGPGIVTTYLQSGSFGEPQVLFDSRVPEPQPAWVDVSTHAHANWVFTQPGVYLLRLEASADLIDGTTVSDTQLIRFAVGTDTNPADALAATWDDASSPDGDVASTDQEPQASDVAAPIASGADPLVPILIGAIGFVAAGLLVGLIVVIVRGNRAKRRALSPRPASAGDSGRSEEAAR